MPAFKWISLLVGSTSFALVAGMMSDLPNPAWRLPGGSQADALLTAALVGALTGGMIWLVGGAYASQLRRAAAAAQSLALDHASPALPAGADIFGLGRLLKPLQQARVELDARVDAAESRCRALEAELARMRGESFAGVSHELRTPLSSIKGCLEMLIDGEAADLPTRSDFYNIILAETNRLSHLIDSMLRISHVQSGAAAPGDTAVDLGELVRESVDTVAPQARARRLTLHCAAPSGVIVRVDAALIQQVMSNLLSNALKYTRPDGRIGVELTADADGGTVSVAVNDTGVGIPAEAMPHLFEKFFRVADHTPLAKGMGLGLNLVRHAIETVHGGTIDVKSEIGTGSTFTFTLPMAENQKGGELSLDTASVAPATAS